MDGGWWWDGCSGNCPSGEAVTTRFLSEVDDAVEWAREHGNKPIAITEWGQLVYFCDLRVCGQPPNPVKNCGYWEELLTVAMPQLDLNPRILWHTYFATRADSCDFNAGWCMNCPGSLIEDDNETLTPLGVLFSGQGRIYSAYLPLIRGSND